MNHGEKASAGATGGAMVLATAGVSETARLSGFYDAVLVGPVEHLRGEYVRIRDRIQRLTAEPKGLGQRISRWWFRRTQLKGLVQAMAAIPLERKWDAVAPNLVTTLGGNLALDTVLAGSSYSTVGPYLFLINTNASAAVIGDTMASHAGWLEVGGTNAPAYTGTRKTVAFSSASAKSKAASSASSFAFTSGGTVGGCGLALGSGAVNTIDSTAGTLYSAGAFTGGSKIVANGDTLNVTYTATI